MLCRGLSQLNSPIYELLGPSTVVLRRYDTPLLPSTLAVKHLGKSNAFRSLTSKSSPHAFRCKAGKQETDISYQLSTQSSINISQSLRWVQMGCSACLWTQLAFRSCGERSQALSVQGSLDDIAQLACFRVPWVCTKSTLTILNICQHQRRYYIDIACHFSLLWWKKTLLTTLNQYNPCSSAFGELTTEWSRETAHPSLHSHSYNAFPYPHWKVQNWRAKSQLEGPSFSHEILFLLVPFLNFWPRGPSARYQTALCTWSHTGR